MSDGFPQRIRTLPPFDGPFDAYRLASPACDPGERHWARFEVETSEIEFWFRPDREH